MYSVSEEWALFKVISNKLKRCEMLKYDLWTFKWTKMATVLRLGLRSFQRTWRRNVSNIAQEYAEEEHHALKTMGTWRAISLFVAVPGCLLCAYSAMQKEKAHPHPIEEHGRDPFLPYPHLRIRAKPFPWGDGNHSLFHNPHTNALPDGYEEW